MVWWFYSYTPASKLSPCHNPTFDQSLRAQNPGWGIRLREDVELEAARAGLQVSARYAMPANNLLLVWTLLP